MPEKVDTVVAVYVVTCVAWIVIVIGLTRMRDVITRPPNWRCAVLLDVCQVAYLFGSSTVWLLCVHSTEVAPSTPFVSLVTLCQAAVVFAWLHWNGLVHIGPRRNCDRYRRSIISEFYESTSFAVEDGQANSGSIENGTGTNDNDNGTSEGADENSINGMPVQPTAYNDHCWLFKILQEYLKRPDDADDGSIENPEGLDLLDAHHMDWIMDTSATVRQLKDMHKRHRDQLKEIKSEKSEACRLKFEAEMRERK